MIVKFVEGIIQMTIATVKTGMQFSVHVWIDTGTVMELPILMYVEVV